MTTPAPPRITSITLNPTTVSIGVPITAIVAWTGFPQMGIAYQWRRGSTAISGQTNPSHTPTGQWLDLNCLVTIDNGRGTATGASLYAEQPEEGEGPSAFTSGFDEGFE